MFHAKFRSQKFSVGDESLEGEELEARVEGWRHKLSRTFSAPEAGHHPALLIDNSFESHVVVLALARGSISCSLIDVTMPAERVKTFLSQLGTSHAFAACENPALAQLHHAGVTVRNVPAVPSVGPSISPKGSGELVIFTSGTTGRPKGVVIDWSTLETWASWRAESARTLSDPYISMGFGPITFAHGILLSTEVFFGGSVVSLEPRDYSPHQLLEKIARQEPTVLTLPPQLLRALSMAAPSYSGPKLTSVRLLSTAGGLVEKEWLHKMRPLLPEDCLVHHNLSASESARFFHWTSPLGNLASTGKLPIGLPRSPEDVRLEQFEGRPDSFSVSVSGAIARGYLDPDDTAARWSTDDQGRVWWESGDIVRWDATESVYYHESRSDDLVKIGGYLVALGDVQQAIIDHSWVEDAVVTSHVSRERVFLIAHLSPNDSLTGDVSELRDHLASVLPRWSIPTVFLTYESIPRTNRGKVDFAVLRKRTAKHLDGAETHSKQGMARDV